MPLMPYARKFITAGFLASLAISFTPAVSHATPSGPENKESIPSFASGSGDKRYIVRYEDNVDAEAKSQSLEVQGVEVKDTISNVIKASVVVANPAEIETLKNSSDVAAVELDQRISITEATSIWGIDRVDQRTGRDGQYSFNEGAGVNVYVVDSGMYPNHSQFDGRVLPGWYGINDGYGVNDCNGHGTHVSGTVAGTTYGVAKRANIVPIRVLDCAGNGWSSTVVAGLDWAIAHHQPGQPAVMNMSVGGFTSASLDYAVRNVINDGITVVAAAGNSNTDACYSAPASVVPAITVAASDMNDYQASFSNWGSCVDVYAPGVGIRSAWNNAPTGYNTLGGTSMASPHVAGAAAIMLSRNRSLSPAQVHQSIIDNATVGIINGIKGATPNRMLFIPTPAGPSCANLKLGDAWAGVGTTCRGSGGAAAGSTEGTPGPNIATKENSVPEQENVPGIEPVSPVTPVPTEESITLPEAPKVAPVTPETIKLGTKVESLPVSSPVAPNVSPENISAQTVIKAPEKSTPLPATDISEENILSVEAIQPEIILPKTYSEQLPETETLITPEGKVSVLVGNGSKGVETTTSSRAIKASSNMSYDLNAGSLAIAALILLTGIGLLVRNRLPLRSS